MSVKRSENSDVAPSAVPLTNDLTENSVDPGVRRSRRQRIEQTTLHIPLPMIFKATTLLSLLLGLTLTSAAGDKRRTIILDGQLPKSAKSILDLQIEKIDLTGISMDAALLQIAEAIETSSHGNLHFSYGVRFAKAEVDEYLRRRIPEDKWKLRDPQIHVRMAKTTLRGVVEQLCNQSGWSYKSTPIGIAFIDDGSYFNQKR